MVTITLRIYYMYHGDFIIALCTFVVSDDCGYWSRFENWDLHVCLKNALIYVHVHEYDKFIYIC